MNANFSKLLLGVQDAISVLNGEAIDVCVLDHLIDKNQIASMQPHSAEDIALTLVDQSEPNSAYVGVYLSPQVVEQVSELKLSRLTTIENLAPLLVATEEISHFHLIAAKASRELQVSALELEWQAEVDKFFVASFFLRNLHQSIDANKLIHALFDRVVWVTENHRDRYTEASKLAYGFLRSLDFLSVERQCPTMNLDLQRVLNTLYLRGWDAKRAASLLRKSS